MRTEYQKLVRDNIPAIIQNDGYVCDIETMGEEEYQQALRQKLVEEACEVATAGSHALIAELADLYEVIDALMKSNDIPASAVRAEQEQRRHERGGFEQRIRLISTASPSDQ